MEIGISILDICDDTKLQELNKLDYKYLHLDIMDGQFVKNTTPPFSLIKQKVDIINKKIDIHLMVQDVFKYIDEYSILKPDNITFHIEVKQDINKLIDKIHSLGISVGLSIKPNTDINTLIPYINKIDLVLIMSVEPGLGGQKFLTNTSNKLKQLIDLKNKYQANFKIEIDGGINPENIKYIKDTNIIVVGSYITKSSDYKNSLDKIKEAIYDSNYK